MNQLKLMIYLNTMEYELSIKPSSPTLSYYPEVKINDDTIELSMVVDNSGNPIFQLMDSYVTKLLIDCTLIENVIDDIITAIKVLDASLELSILPLSDYKELISKLSLLFEHIEPIELVEVKRWGEYCKCEVRPTAQHLPIYGKDYHIDGYFEGDKLYMYDRKDMDEYVGYYMDYAKYRSHKVSNIPSRREYQTELLNRFGNLLK